MRELDGKEEGVARQFEWDTQQFFTFLFYIVLDKHLRDLRLIRPCVGQTRIPYKHPIEFPTTDSLFKQAANVRFLDTAAILLSFNSDMADERRSCPDRIQYTQQSTQRYKERT